MPIIQTNSGYGYVYKSNVKPKKSIPPFFKFIGFAVIVFGVVIGALWLSKMIPSFVGIDNNLLVNDRQVYCVSAGVFEDYSTAFAFSETIKKQGGAGYVLKRDNSYHVLLSAYPKKDSALKVIENLSYENIEAELCVISLEKISMKISDENNDKMKVKSALNVFYNSFDALYSISIDYDQNALSKSEALNQIEVIQENVSKSKNGISTKNNEISDAVLVYLKLYMDDLSQALSQLETCKDNFKAEIKATYFKCIELYSSFRQEIGK